MDSKLLHQYIIKKVINLKKAVEPLVGNAVILGLVKVSYVDPLTEINDIMTFMTLQSRQLFLYLCTEVS